MFAEDPAFAQMPWPSDAPQSGAAAPWPGERPAAPAGMSPMMGAPRPIGPAGMGGGGMGGGGGPPPCMAEFTKLREDVEKKGLAAKAAGQKHAAREEMCKLITSYATSEAKWVKFVEGGVSSCGIPPQIATQLKQVHTNTEQTREKICAAGPAGGPAAAPSLSEALGTNRLATPDSTKTAGGGTMDTMTGSAIRP
jgi:hypothetical protein